MLVDLTVDGSTLPTLTVAGYYQGRQVATLQMSSNPATDRLGLALEDPRIVGDGSDTTRLGFRALDAFGNQRPYVSGDVAVSLRGPAAIVGQNPFAFAEYGGVGAVIIRSRAKRTGTVHITARHPTLGAATAILNGHQGDRQAPLIAPIYAACVGGFFGLGGWVKVRLRTVRSDPVLAANVAVAVTVTRLLAARNSRTPAGVNAQRELRRSRVRRSYDSRRRSSPRCARVVPGTVHASVTRAAIGL